MPNVQHQKDDQMLSSAIDVNNDDESQVEENDNGSYQIIPLPDQIDVKTGEEDEDLLYVQRAELFILTISESKEIEWKERGLGNVKILRNKQSKSLRVLMRRQQVLTICLNHVLSPDVVYKQKDEKSWVFMVPDFGEGKTVLKRFTLRFLTSEIAQDFIEAVKNALNGTAEPISEVDTQVSYKCPEYRSVF